MIQSEMKLMPKIHVTKWIYKQAFTPVLEVADIQGVDSVRTFCISAPDGQFCQKFGALWI